MQFIKLFSLISFIVAAAPPQFVFSKSVSGSISKLGKTAESTGHNSIVVLKKGGTKTFYSDKLEKGKAQIINANTGSRVELPADNLLKIRGDKANDELQPLFTHAKPGQTGSNGGIQAANSEALGASSSANKFSESLGAPVSANKFSESLDDPASVNRFSESLDAPASKNNKLKMGAIGAGLVGAGAFVGGTAVAASDRDFEDFDEFEDGQF
jgi:hypothetical protein